MANKLPDIICGKDMLEKISIKVLDLLFSLEGSWIWGRKWCDESETRNSLVGRLI